MNIDFELTMQDYIDFNFSYLDTSKSMKYIKFIQYILLPILFLITQIFAVATKNRPIWYAVSSFLIVTILWV